MNVKDSGSFQEILKAQRRAIKEKWYRIFVPAEYSPKAREERQINDLLDRIFDCLIAEPFRPDRIRAIGASLTIYPWLTADTLGSTLETMANQIGQTMAVDHLAELQPRLTRLIIELVIGFSQETLRMQNERLEALSAAGPELIARLDLDELLHAIVIQAVDLLKGRAGCLCLHQPDRDILASAVTFGDVCQVGTVYRKGEGLCGQVWETEEALIAALDDVEASHTSIGAPICWGDLFLGVLIVQADGSRRFSASDVKLLSMFATQTAIAIRNVRLYEQEQKRAKQMVVVNRVGRKVVSTLEPKQLMQDIVTEIRCSFEYYNVIILLLDAARQELGNQAIAGGFENLAPPNYRQPVGEGIIGYVAQTGQTLLVNDIDQDPRYIVGFREEVQTKAELCIPLKRAGEIIGVLDVQEPVANAFDHTDVIALETLADQIAMAIDNARLYQQAQQDAETKSVLLREINHRVKNNLTAIIGLIYTEQERLPEEHRSVYQSIMQNLINRIEGLAIAHSMLSASEWQALSLSELVTEVIRVALPALPLGKRITIEVSPSTATISPEQAQNIALITSELTTNTIKHALREKDVVNIVVDIITEGDVVQLTFKNDGPGYSREILEEERYSGGLELVKNITEVSLRGAFSVKNEEGPVTIMRFSTQERMKPSSSSSSSSSSLG